MLTIDHDITLIKLAEPITFGNNSKLTPICIGEILVTDSQQNKATLLDVKNVTTEKTCFSSGWGKLKYGMSDKNSYYFHQLIVY